MEYAGQVLYFVLLLLGYMSVLIAVLTLPFAFFGFGIAIVHRGRQANPRILEYLTRAEITVTCLSMVGLGYLLYRDSAQVLPYLRFWESPALLGALLFTIMLRSRGAASSNPIMRDAATGSPAQAISILIVILIAEFFTLSVWQGTEVFALGTALVICLIATGAQYFSLPTSIRMVEQLEARHKRLSHSLAKLHQIAFLLGDTGNWEATQESVREVEKLSAAALAALNAKQFDQTESYMVQAETEVAHTEQLIRNKLQYSISDDLEARIAHALEDIDALKNEFEEAGLAVDSLAPLRGRVEALHLRIPPADAEADVLSDRLQEFEHVFREIGETKTALRFRRNIESVIDLQNEDLGTSRRQLRLASALGIAADPLNEARDQLGQHIENLKSNQISQSSDLVAGYRSLQDANLNFRTEQARLANKVDRGWTNGPVIENMVFAYVPKFCSTTNATRVAVYVDFSDVQSETCTVTVDGTLVELPEEKSLTVKARPGRQVAVEYLEFVGKRGGRGSMSLRAELDGKEGRVSIPLQIIPSLNDTLQRSVFTGGFGAALAGFGTWYTTGEVNQAGVIGAAIGAVFSILPFLLKRIRYRGVPA